MTDQAIFADVSNTIKNAIQKIYDEHGEVTRFASAALESVLKDIMRQISKCLDLTNYHIKFFAAAPRSVVGFKGKLI